MLVVYPNQKIVTVHKAPADKNHLYGVLNKEALLLACRNLKQNELKVFLYLSFNQPEFQMAMSSADIAEKIGSTEDGVRAAVRGLQKKAYLIKNHGNVYDFYEVPQSEAEAECGLCNDKKAVQKTDSPALTTGKPSVHEAKRKGEIIKENTEKNTLNYMKGDLADPDSGEWDKVFRRIKVKRYPHSMKQLREAAGVDLDVNVVRRIVSQNWASFEKKLEEKEGYRFSMLLNLVKDQYEKWKFVLASEETERRLEMERWRNEPRMDYDNLSWREPVKPEGLDDISELLNELFDDVDDVS